ncbi:MAG: GNAT family protein, partial [Terracidiphilus sp.]
IDYNGFCNAFSRDARVRKYQFVIEKISNQELIGLTFVHSYSEIDRHCFLNVFINERYEGKGYGVDVFALMFHFLFEQVNIEKLYVEAFDFNHFSIKCIQASGMKEIKRLVGKRLHLGVRHDSVRFLGERDLLPKIDEVLKNLS